MLELWFLFCIKNVFTVCFANWTKISWLSILSILRKLTLILFFCKSNVLYKCSNFQNKCVFNYNSIQLQSYIVYNLNGEYKYSFLINNYHIDIDNNNHWSIENQNLESGWSVVDIPIVIKVSQQFCFVKKKKLFCHWLNMFNHWLCIQCSTRFDLVKFLFKVSVSENCYFFYPFTVIYTKCLSA